MTDSERAQQAILTLLAKRGGGKTICPSEAARLLAGPDGNWRARMEIVHEAADALRESGKVRLSARGKEIDQRRGAYRIGAADRS